MTVRYLAVPRNARDLVAHLDPVWGTTLIDGRIVAKIRVDGEPPEGVEDLGGDPVEVRELCEQRETFP